MSKSRKTLPFRKPQQDAKPYADQDNSPGDDEQEYIEDIDPPLTEEDLQDNKLSIVEADEVEWDLPDLEEREEPVNPEKRKPEETGEQE